MNKTRTSIAISENFDRHPAVIAWNKLHNKGLDLRRIDIIKNKNRSFVCRLVSLDPKVSDTIAKRREIEKAKVERFVYEEILPQIGMETIRFHGFVEEEELLNESQFAWLFFEDLGNLCYSPLTARQRTFLARWLASFHIAAANLDLKSHFPIRGAAHHKIFLQSSLELIVLILSKSKFEKDERLLLEHILKKFKCLEEQWLQIESFCSHVPQTVIHGDCLPKNIYIPKNKKQIATFPFDWSAAGYGPIGLDLGQTSLHHRNQWPDDPDIFEYWSIIKDKWRDLYIDVIERLVHLGRLFWAIDVISWALPEFNCKWVSREKLIINLRIYEKVLKNVVQATGWRY